MRFFPVVFLCVIFSADAGDELKIKRFFQSSGHYMKVLLEVDRPMKVKCAVYDKGGEPLRVDSQRVSPPLDEVMIRTGESTALSASVKCWVMG